MCVRINSIKWECTEVFWMDCKKCCTHVNANADAICANALRGNGCMAMNISQKYSKLLLRDYDMYAHFCLLSRSRCLMVIPFCRCATDWSMQHIHNKWAIITSWQEKNDILYYCTMHICVVYAVRTSVSHLKSSQPLQCHCPSTKTIMVMTVMGERMNRKWVVWSTKDELFYMKCEWFCRNFWVQKRNFRFELKLMW